MNAERIVGLVHRMLRPVRVKMDQMVTRALIRAIDDGTLLQQVKAQTVGGTTEDVEHLQPGGITHVAHPGAEGALMRTTQGVELAVAISNRALRPSGLQPGETMVYGTTGQQAPSSAGHYVHLSASGEIVIRPIDGQKVIVQGDLQVTGAAGVDGAVTAKGAVTSDGEVTANAQLPTKQTLSGHQTGSPFGPLSNLPGT